MSSAKGSKAFLTFVPVAVIMATLFSLPVLADLQPSTLEKITYIPYLLILCVILMGGFFKRHRVTLISTLIGITYFTIHNTVIEPELTQHNKLILELIAIFVPLNIAFLTGLKEQRLLSLQNFIAIMSILVQIIIGYWSIQNYPDLVSAFIAFIPDLISGFVPEHFSFVTTIAFSLSIAIAIIHIVLKGTVFEFSFAGALLSILFFIQSGMQTPVDSLFVVAASLIIAWGLIHNSYLIAYIDELTDLPGRRSMNEESARLRGLYAIAMLDIDHFKKFNDTYGHDVGDQVLRMVASKIGEVGGGGKAFRYGGEEFAVLFQGKDSKSAFPYLSNLREAIDQTSLILRNRDRPSNKPEKVPPRRVPWQEVHVTISIGVADSSSELNKTGEVLKAADEALYRSKEKGRNRISQYAMKDYTSGSDEEEAEE